MRRLLLLSLVLPALLAAQSQDAPKPLPRPVPEKPAPSKPFGNLRVHVENARGAPVVGALVAIEELKRAHETEETGNVFLGWVPVGKYEVKVTKAGYLGATAAATIEPDLTCVITVLLVAEGK
jgi:hypothetical protein